MAPEGDDHGLFFDAKNRRMSVLRPHSSIIDAIPLAPLGDGLDVDAKRRRFGYRRIGVMLGRKSGATIAQLQKAFGWKPHTARAAISTLRKAGFAVERDDTEKGAVYRVVGEI